jgi:hypothetical protein
MKFSNSVRQALISRLARSRRVQSSLMRADLADLCAVAVAAFVTRSGVNRLEFDRELADNGPSSGSGRRRGPRRLAASAPLGK